MVRIRWMGIGMCGRWGWRSGGDVEWGQDAAGSAAVAGALREADEGARGRVRQLEARTGQPGRRIVMLYWREGGRLATIECDGDAHQAGCAGAGSEGAAGEDGGVGG